MSNNYAGMRVALRDDPVALKRCAGRLVKIRRSLADLRARKSESSLLLATWNIRDFDSNKFGFGPRLPETFYYIAEMIAAFDLVAVQEVNRDLSALKTVMDILGREWDYIVTDTTDGVSGNGERMAFVYNVEKVYFRKVAGEVVLPQGQLIVVEDDKRGVKPAEQTGAEVVESGAGQQFARTPFLVAFQSGWFKFSLCTVHIYFGDDSGAKLKRRIQEIEKLVKFFADRQDQEAKLDKGRLKDDGRRTSGMENYILLGDFNVVSPEHETMKALTSHGFTVPDAIGGTKVREADAAVDGKVVALKENANFYDQIAVRVKDKRFEIVGGGMVDMYADVFRNDDVDRALYAAHVPKKDPEKNKAFKATTPEKLFEKWRTWQMSDHSPLWVEIKTDFTEDYLTKIVEGEGA